jgi:hypothetical protein
MAAVTYTADHPVAGRTFTCKRCARVYAYPTADAPLIRCECGWRYELLSTGDIAEAFRPRIGQGMSVIPAHVHRSES